MENEKIYGMDFYKIYQLLLNKALRKGRTKEETDEVIRWLTGYSQTQLDRMCEQQLTYAEFFQQAPALDEKRDLVRGVVCGVRVENIEDPLMRSIRCLDKLVDELSRGKRMDKILNRGRL